LIISGVAGAADLDDRSEHDHDADDETRDRGGVTIECTLTLAAFNPE
jgi:hypothetical protein